MKGLSLLSIMHWMFLNCCGVVWFLTAEECAPDYLMHITEVGPRRSFWSSKMWQCDFLPWIQPDHCMFELPGGYPAWIYGQARVTFRSTVQKTSHARNTHTLFETCAKVVALLTDSLGLRAYFSLMKELTWVCWDSCPKVMCHLPTTRRPLTIVDSTNWNSISFASLAHTLG